MKNFLLFISLISSLSVFGQSLKPDAYKSERTTSSKSNYSLYYNPYMDKYDIHFVKLDIEVSDMVIDVAGNATILAKATQELDTLMLDFKDNMTIDSMFINNIKVTPIRKNDQIKYFFNPALGVGEDIDVRIFYKGEPDGEGVEHSYNDGWNKNVTWTLSESFHAKEWWPCKQVMSDKIDSTHLFFTCDDNCMVGSNGLLTNTVDVGNNKKRFEWKTKYPINYYLISYAVAEYEDYSIYAEPAGSDPILIQNFIYNTDGCMEYYKSGIDATASMLELFSEKYNLYPFSKEKYGHCLASIGGGMEHQTMTTLNSFNYNLVSHELAHMWFGNYVTCATWQDIWINEGFASYSEFIALEDYNYTAAQNWLKSTYNSVLDVYNNGYYEPVGSVYIPFNEAFNEGRIFSGRLSYDKGAILVHMIRYEINDDELFFESLRNYLTEFGDSVATGEDFKNSIETNTGVELDAFFDQWYYGKGSPKFDVLAVQQNDTLKMTITQTTSSPSTKLFKTPVDFKIVYPDGDTTLRLYQTANQESFIIPMSDSVTNVVVDPDNWILDREGRVRIFHPVTVGVDNQMFDNKSLFNFQPNPVKESIRVSFNVNLYNNEKQVQIIDINGRLINSYRITENSLPIDVSYLSNGIYFIRGISSKNAYTYKFIKQ